MVAIPAHCVSFTLAAGLLLGCSTAANSQTIPAFPGAEGFGSTATGGCGMPVYYVSNLSDDGNGSLRDAARGSNRTILFRVSGTIVLDSPLEINGSNVTIAGQSAPGEGICLRGKELVIGGDNIVVRFLRLRPGDERHEEHDALTIRHAHRVIVDHCSMSWSTDSVNDVVGESTNVTVQWCIISEPLNQSVHHKGTHGYGTGWGSGAAGGNSYHHNLLAHCNSRSPRLGSEKGALVDVRNNVIYDMGSGWAYGGERARVNYVGNYYRPGPSTRRPAQIFQINGPDTRFYLRENVVEEYTRVTRDNVRGLAADEGVDLASVIVSRPFAAPLVETYPAARNYELVLEYAGATLPERDAVDQRVLAEVRDGTGHVIDTPAEVGGWPPLASADPPDDSDADGMPDDWERSHGLDPNDAADGISTTPDGYTHLEGYLNQLAVPAMPGTASSGP